MTTHPVRHNPTNIASKSKESKAVTNSKSKHILINSGKWPRSRPSTGIKIS